jgi:capsular exopolysaccharide synthesis family protein
MIRTPAVPEQGLTTDRVGEEIVDGVDDRLVSLLTPDSFAAEQYRTLRHFVEQKHTETNLAVLAVASPGSREGKTTTTINLAGAIAQARDTKVLIVDADLRAPAVKDMLGLRGVQRRGLVDAIVSGLSLDDVIIELPTFNLSVVGTGETSGAPYELLKSPRFGQFLAEARERFDYVLLDTPPVVAVPDCRVIAASVDGFFIVVTAHKTPMRALADSLDALGPRKTVGLIFNADDGLLVRGAYYGYKPSPEGRGITGWSRAIRRVRRSRVPSAAGAATHQSS